MKKMTSISLVLTSLLTLSGCAPKHLSEKIKTIGSKYFSMRPQQVGHFVGIVQLKSEALLTQAPIVDGKPQIDPDAKEALIAEQEEFISKLQDISGDIKIITTYKLVLNAIAFSAPGNTLAEIEKMSGQNGAKALLPSAVFHRTEAVSIDKKLSFLSSDINEKNSVTFIGADKAHKLGIRGQNITVGIIDTGLDYTHSMLGGPGKKEIYKELNPNIANEYFPNDKVVGGVDFVGTKFNTRGTSLEELVPVRDVNPLDESEHGSHVAGSVAGLGDGEKTYSGVAPEAKLYALKVFGKEGSTSDIAVISALEYAADPTEKLDPNNHLDVVNLSLGGPYGKPKIFYTQAVENLTKAGTIVVASAGNSGDTPYITGAPATSDEAISVAASIDNMPHNILFNSIEVILGENKLTEELVEGAKTLPAHESQVSENLVHIGFGGEEPAELPEELKVKVKGRIALIDRGGRDRKDQPITFQMKLSLAEKLGAIGVVVANNSDANPIQMGTDSTFKFPAVMVTKALGAKIKAELALGKDVRFNFTSDVMVDKSELIDTMTDFSSRGPRSQDSLIKPEITAPGENIISTASGTGTEGVKMSGTSMSGPHIAGVMALLRQAFPNESVKMLKARLLNTAKILKDDNGVHIPVARQGAGRVQVEAAIKSKIIALPATLSLKELFVSAKKYVPVTITLTNTSEEEVLLGSSKIESANISASLPSSVKIPAKGSVQVKIEFGLKRVDLTKNNIEADGFIIFTNVNDKSKISLPFLGILNKVSDISGSDFVTQTESEADKAGTSVTLKLTNKSKSSGDALIFNLLGVDEKKTLNESAKVSVSDSCDLESAGIRIIDRDEDGKNFKILQVGIKLYDTLTSWQPCDVSLQIDADNDGKADQELVGIRADNINGIPLGDFASLLFDAKLARLIRGAFEIDPKNNPENYIPAVMDARGMLFYDHSNVAIIETDVSKIIKGKKGVVGIKLAVTHLEGDGNQDDFLGNHENTWQKINLTEDAFAFYDMPEFVNLEFDQTEEIVMRRGLGQGKKILLLYPHNTPISLLDKQSQILTEKLLISPVPLL